MGIEVLQRAASFPPAGQSCDMLPDYLSRPIGTFKTDEGVLQMSSTLTPAKIAQMGAGLSPKTKRQCFAEPCTEPDLPIITSRCVIETKTAARPANEDTHFNDGDLYGIFDGHNGKAVSQLCQDSFSQIFRQEQQRRPKDEPLTHQVVATLFDAVVTQLHKQIKETKLSGGTTSLVVFETDESIFVDVRGDCRLTLVDRTTGDICELPRSYIDMAHNKGVVDCGVGPALTAVHVMPGAAKPRAMQGEGQPAVASSWGARTQSPMCTEESLSQWKIDNDNTDEEAHYEWMVFNLNRAEQLVSEGNAAAPEKVRALVPKFTANGWRLSQCGVQPTRSIGSQKEQVTKQGQVWRFDVPIQNRLNTMLIMCCDGAEDNGAIKATDLGKLCCLSDGPRQLFEKDNLLLGAVNQPHRSTFNPVGSFPSMMRWVAAMADSGKIVGPDWFWCKSIREASERLATIAGDEARWEAAFSGATEENMLELAGIAIDYANVCGTADNVTFGFKLWCAQKPEATKSSSDANSSNHTESCQGINE